MWRAIVSAAAIGSAKARRTWDPLRRANGLDRLADPAGRLVQTTAEFRAEAQGQRRTGLRQQIGDPLEAEPAKPIDQLRRQAQRRDRQRRDVGFDGVQFGDEGRTRREARQRMRRTAGVGDRAVGPNADAGELVDQDGEHGGFAAMQMIGAGAVDDDAVGRIRGHDRGNALQHPERETIESVGVGRRVGVLNDQTSDQNLRLGRRHADAKTGGLGRGIRRQHHPPPPVTTDQHEGYLSPRRCVAGRPSDPVGGQGRKEERDHPCHRRPPVRNPRFRRHGNG